MVDFLVTEQKKIFTGAVTIVILTLMYSFFQSPVFLDECLQVDANNPLLMIGLSALLFATMIALISGYYFSNDDGVYSKQDALATTTLFVIAIAFALTGILYSASIGKISFGYGFFGVISVILAMFFIALRMGIFLHKQGNAHERTVVESAGVLPEPIATPTDREPAAETKKRAWWVVPAIIILIIIVMRVATNSNNRNNSNEVLDPSWTNQQSPVKTNPEPSTGPWNNGVVNPNAPLGSSRSSQPPPR